MIKYLIMDVDGTITDGKIYMGANGEAVKAFSVKDGYVINYIIKPFDIVPVIITARTSSIVQHRCDELGISEVYQGRLDKLSTLKEVVGSDGLNTCAYFGDDILDMNCMLPIKAAGGIVGCPADAVQEVKAVSDYICVNKAGEGALREFAEWLVSPHIDKLEIQRRVEEVKEYLLNLKVDVKEIGNTFKINDYFFYSIQAYQPSEKSECKLESHRKYIDVQVIVKGQECMHIADISRLSLSKEYNYDKDIMFWNMPHFTTECCLRAGDYIVIYPESAHGVSKIANFEDTVVKLVGKIKIN